MNTLEKPANKNVIFLLYQDSIHLENLNVIFESFPQKLRNKIDLIYYITKPLSYKKANYKTLYNKPLIFFTYEKWFLDGLSNDLRSSEVLLHIDSITGPIPEILKSLKNYRVFINEDKKGSVYYVERNELLLKINTELNLISKEVDKQLNERKLLYKNKKLPISAYYTRSELLQALFSKRKISILKFNADRPEDIHKREIFKDLDHRFLRIASDNLIRKTLIHNKVKTEIIKGVENLNEVDQSNLLNEIHLNASDKLNYRIIINGDIPDYLLKNNFHIKRFSAKDLSTHTDSTASNRTALFIDAFEKNLPETKSKQPYMTKVILVKDDLYKNLLSDFPVDKSIQEALNEVFKSFSEESLDSYGLNRIRFWYSLLSNQKFHFIKPSIVNATIKRVKDGRNNLTKPSRTKIIKKKKKETIKSKIDSLRKDILSRIEKSKTQIKPIKVELTDVNLSVPVKQISNKRILVFELVGNKWKISVDSTIYYAKADVLAVHMTKELYINYNSPRKRIDAEELDEIINLKLPEKKKKSDKKKSTILKKQKSKGSTKGESKPATEKVLNKFRQRITSFYNNYSKLTFLVEVKHFEFSNKGCYFIQNETLSIKFIP